MSTRAVQPWQIQYIEQNHETQIPPDMAAATGLSLSKVYVICKKRRWKFKSAKSEKRISHLSFDLSKKNTAYHPDPPSQKIIRPPAVYSNSTPFGIAKEIHS
jgi:hypothetical protein